MKPTLNIWACILKAKEVTRHLGLEYRNAVDLFRSGLTEWKRQKYEPHASGQYPTIGMRVDDAEAQLRAMLLQAMNNSIQRGAWEDVVGVMTDFIGSGLEIGDDGLCCLHYAFEVSLAGESSGKETLKLFGAAVRMRAVCEILKKYIQCDATWATEVVAIVESASVARRATLTKSGQNFDIVKIQNIESELANASMWLAQLKEGAK